jgi:hypothetical protein
MTPSRSIVQAAAKTQKVVDKTGRNLLIRKPNALDTLRLFKAAGPALAQNEPWLAMAALAWAVMEVGNEGLTAVAQHLDTNIEDARIERDGLGN